MARIYPEYLPESILKDPGRRAECTVYSVLKTLPERYLVFYSIHWQDHTNNWGVSEGEADFIVAHPDMGIIVLEVKGGGIRYDALTNQWYSHSAGGNVYPIKDPVEQGRRNHYKLLESLETLPGWQKSDINIWHAVCFPDIYTRGKKLRPDLPNEMVIDREGLEDIQNSIKNLFHYLFGNNIHAGAPGEKRMQILENYLARSFELRTPLGVEIDYEDRQLIQLTEQQFYALSILGDRKRVAIGGCAGSGKTMLALEKARQFSELGLNVLLTCYNAPLADYLHKRLPNVDIVHFHELCRQAAKHAEIPLEEKTEEKTFFESTLPEALLNAAAKIGRVYDAIIVDEGQDFKESYWIALESLLKQNGYLYIFFDNNQNLYNGTLEFGGLITEPPFQLTQNCRNTQAIHKTVIKFHNNPSSIRCAGPAGRPPEVIPYRDEQDGLRQLQKLLHRLVVDENIHPSDIVILTPRGPSTKLKSGLRLGMFELSPYPSSGRNVIQATSVYRFKGLERKVVILTEIDSSTAFNPDVLMYVGCSRARTHLVILFDETAPLTVINRIQQF